jgi:CDP-diacylglycerol---serine O-phosphatidyltransferase
MNEIQPDTSPNGSAARSPLTAPQESSFGDPPGKLALPGGVTMSSRAGFVIVNAFTSFNLLVGVLSLIAATTGSIATAAWGLLLCVLLDTCDGSLARRWQVVTAFGAQLDSLADMTSFIIAGTALSFYWARSTTSFIPIVAVSGLYALSGAIRLARFNTTAPKSDYFQGVPTTFGATVIAANYLAYPALDAHWIMVLVGLLAVLMVSTLPYPKLATLRRCPPWVVPALIVGAIASLTWTVWIMTAAYIGLGPAIWLYHRLRSGDRR